MKTGSDADFECFIELYGEKIINNENYKEKYR